METVIEIDGTKLGSDSRPYVIAEVGINARNDLELAKRFIEVAASAGADAVKFQTHLADAEISEPAIRSIGAGDVYETVAECEWTAEEHEMLRAHAKASDVTFLSTPFSVEAVDLLEEIDVPAIKIGSGELTNRELLARVAETGKPLLVSTGMHTREEIAEACSFLESVAEEFALFYCVSEYPTSPADFDFGTIQSLEQLADVPVGFSDHSTGAEAAKVAIGNGAAMIEKHFTIDRRLPGPDQEVSIEPETLEDLCSFADLYHETSTEKTELQGEEPDVKAWAQHSLVAKRPIEQGEEFTTENLTTKRPGSGISANRYFDIVGRTAATDIEENIVLSSDDVQ
ncbi:N-acetylneuraminate synthase family protein [Halovivax cerinus]|uniref:N-acetylneuraminate synthase family protein n=1 Tax=Halovivax cerinus TaxID=1487865 RepID=A0ABD5NPS4_9EURY